MAKLSRSQLSSIKKQIKDKSDDETNKDNKKDKNNLKNVKKQIKDLKKQGVIKDIKPVFKIQASVGDLVTFNIGKEEILGIIVKSLDNDYFLVSSNRGVKEVYAKSIRKFE